jgi:hypothetical protein
MQDMPAKYPFVRVKAIFENGDSLTSGFNGTLEDARAYYVGKRFDLTRDVDNGPEIVVKCVRVEEIKGEDSK